MVAAHLRDVGILIPAGGGIGAAWPGQHTGQLAVLVTGHIVAGLKALPAGPLMHLAHNGPPDLGGRVAGVPDGIGDGHAVFIILDVPRLIGLIAGIVTQPAHTHIVWGNTHKPLVHTVIGGTGLARHRDIHSPQVGGSAGALPPGDLLQQAVHHGGGLSADDPDRNGVFLQDHIAVGILHTGVAVRLGAHAAVAEHLIGARQLHQRHALGKGAQRHGAVAVVPGGQGIHVQRILEEIVAGGGAQLLGDLHRHGIDGANEGSTHRHKALEAVILVLGHPQRLAVAHLIGVDDDLPVLDDGGIGDEVFFDAQHIGGDGLDGGADLTGSITGPVPDAVALLAAVAAHNTL